MDKRMLSLILRYIDDNFHNTCVSVTTVHSVPYVVVIYVTRSVQCTVDGIRYGIWHCSTLRSSTASHQKSKKA
jgi:hypothetical protein